MRNGGLRYMPALDGLRAVAVLAVLLYHGDVSWAQGGYFGVDAFFVLSGFLITSLLLGEWDATGHIDLKAFWTRRAKRLLPAMALVLVAVAVAWYAGHSASPVELGQLRRDGLSTIFYVANWNQLASKVSYFQQFAAPSALRHTWSLAIEEQFYLVWPLVIFVALRRRVPRPVLLGGCAVLAAGSAVLMGVLYHPGHDPSRVYYGTDTRAQSLLIGAVVAIALVNRRPIAARARRMSLHGAAIAAAAVLAYIWSTTNDSDGWQYRGGFVLAAALVSLVVVSVTTPGSHGPLGTVLSSAPLRTIGLISYGLYLWHWPIYVYLSPDRTGLDDAPLLFVRLLTTFAIATVSFVLVERPVRHGRLPRWSVRVAAPTFAAGLGFALVATTAGAVPAQLSAVSASQIAAPPAPPPGPSLASVAGSAAARPMRVMLVGDSVSDSLSPGLKQQAAARGWVFWNAAVPGCGLSNEVGEHWYREWRPANPKCLPAYRTRFRTQVAQFHPDVVVMLFGAQDTYDRRLSGKVYKFDTPDGANLARKDLQDAVNAVSSTGAHVVLLTTPYYVQGWPMKIDVNRSCFNGVWINRYNTFQRDIVARNGGRVSILELNHFLDPDGKYTDTVNGIKVRSFDRVHLSEAGSAYTGKWLAPQIARFAARPLSRAKT